MRATDESTTSFPWHTRLLDQLSGSRSLNSIYKSIDPAQGPVEFASSALSSLHIDCAPSKQTLAHLPRTGRVIVVANHPFGPLDSLAAVRVVGERRPDVRVLANAELHSLGSQSPLLFGVGASNIRGNALALRQALRWLEDEHALVIFPAGDIAHFDARARCVTDPPWSPMLGRLVKRAGAPVVPLHFAGRNSTLFQLAGVVSRPLRRWMLPRELRRRMHSQVDAHLGDRIAIESMHRFRSPESLALHLRLRTLLAPATDLDTGSDVAAPTMLPVAPEQPADSVEQELARLDDSSLLATQGDMQVRVAQAHEIPYALSEIGRLREMTARAAGGGTGKSRDMDRFDADYEHLLVWNPASRQIFAACRLGRVNALRHRLGNRGLHSAEHFNYRDSFFLLLGSALEIGHAFARPDRPRGSGAFNLLWRGITEYVARHPGFTRLLATVTLGANYQEASRHLMVDFLRNQRLEGLLARLARPRHPVQRSATMRSMSSELAMLDSLETLEALIEDLEPDGKGVPPMLRKCLKFGGRVLGFNAGAGAALSCLMLIDPRSAVRKLATRL